RRVGSAECHDGRRDRLDIWPVAAGCAGRFAQPFFFAGRRRGIPEVVVAVAVAISAIVEVPASIVPIVVAPITVSRATVIAWIVAPVVIAIIVAIIGARIVAIVVIIAVVVLIAIIAVGRRNLLRRDAPRSSPRVPLLRRRKRRPRRR